MKRIFFFFLLLPLLLYAEWDQLFTTDEDPALYHHVSVLTGNLNLCIQDGLVQGAVSYHLMRTYSSSGALERSEKNIDLTLKNTRGWLIQGGWSFLPHTTLFMEYLGKYPNEEERDRLVLNEESIEVYLPEPNGNLVHYTYDHHEGDYLVFLTPQIKTGQCSGLISGKTNPRNNSLLLNTKAKEATLFLANGGRRYYKGHRMPVHGSDLHYFRLVSETLPSKHQIHYNYEKVAPERLTDIHVLNPSGTKTYSWVHFDMKRTQVPFHFSMISSDQKAIDYTATEFKDRDYLCGVESNCRPLEMASYMAGRSGTGARINGYSLDQKQQLRVGYYLPADKKTEAKYGKDPKKIEFCIDKVRLLEAPLGPSGEMLPIGQFSYSPGLTTVVDVEGCETVYRHEDGVRLLAIESYNEKKELSSITKFFWDENGRLKSKALLDPNGRALLAKTFQYDAYSNVTEETLYGNLTGSLDASFAIDHGGYLSGAATIRKRFQYLPMFNIPLLEEEESGLTYRYEYLPNTDLLKAKFTCDKDRIFLREFFFYDEDHLLVAEMVDDGKSSDPSNLQDVTQRRIRRYELNPSTGMAKTIAEFYWDPIQRRELLLKKTVLTYSEQNRIVEEAIYDAHESYRYILYTDYDAHGHVTKKTTPLGQTNSYVYDERGNLLEVKEVGSPKKIYTNNPIGRPIACQEIDNLGNRRNSQATYDAKGRVLTQVDFRGNTTYQSYDVFGRCLKTVFPKALDEKGQSYEPTIHYTYDTQGNLASTTTPNGETTRTFYNTLRKPTRIIQPDGTELRHIYNRDGTLAKTIYPDQTQVEYVYDLLQRMISKQIHSSEGELLSSESWTYGAFDLLSHTDVRGTTTVYTYDGAGRKIAEET